MTAAEFVARQTKARNSLAFRLVTNSIRGILRVLCRIDDREMARIPANGPMLLLLNHINFLEVPALYTFLAPRVMTGFAKVEVWDNPALCWLANLWSAIPLQRGEVDLTAFRYALAVLEAGRFVAVAPEGTRSGHGRLQKGLSGIVMLALRSGAPLMPVAHYGGETFWQNFSRLRRTEFRFVVGDPFYLEPGTSRVTREMRELMISEVMFQMAALLPPAYRGVYADLSTATETYLRFPEGASSNLARAEHGG